MKLTTSELEHIRVNLVFQWIWFEENHVLAFNERSAFYFASGAARVLSCLGPEAEELGKEMQRSALRVVIEALSPEVYHLIPASLRDLIPVTSE